MRGSRGGRRAALTALLVGAALAATLPGAASGQSPAASPAPSGAPPASVAPSPGASVAPSPSFTPLTPPVTRLVDAGRKPRAIRRYAYTPGATGTMVMDITQGVRTVIGDGVETAFDLPAIRYTLQLTVTAVDAAGVADVMMRVAAIEVLDNPDAEDPLDPAIVAELDATLQGIVGATITARMAPDGSTLGASADLSGLDPTLAQQMTGLVDQSNQLSQPLPAEPIGRDARWVSTSALTTNGISFKARTTATLKAVDGDLLTIAFKGRQTGVPGPVELAGLPPGTTAELVEMDGESAGRTVVDLGGLVPRSTSTGTIRVKLSATDGTSTQSTTSTVTTNLSVKPGE